jgi:hypothetical protein
MTTASRSGRLSSLLTCFNYEQYVICYVMDTKLPPV